MAMPSIRSIQQPLTFMGGRTSTDDLAERDPWVPMSCCSSLLHLSLRDSEDVKSLLIVVRRREID